MNLDELRNLDLGVLHAKAGVLRGMSGSAESHGATIDTHRGRIAGVWRGSDAAFADAALRRHLDGLGTIRDGTNTLSNKVTALADALKPAQDKARRGAAIAESLPEADFDAAGGRVNYRWRDDLWGPYANATPQAKNDHVANLRLADESNRLMGQARTEAATADTAFTAAAQHMLPGQGPTPRADPGPGTSIAPDGTIVLNSGQVDPLAPSPDEYSDTPPMEIPSPDGQTEYTRLQSELTLAMLAIHYKGWTTAEALWRHWAEHSGTDFDVDVNRLRQEPEFDGAVNGTDQVLIASADQAAKNRGLKGGDQFVQRIDSRWQGYNFANSADDDLHYGIGNFQYRSHGTVTYRTSPEGKLQRRVERDVDVYKPWNFDKGKTAAGIPLDDFHEMPKYGLGRDFNMRGTQHLDSGWQDVP